jgi:hypothetical protein
MFWKWHYAIYFRRLHQGPEELGTLVDVVQGWAKAQRKAKLYNESTLAYGWYYAKRLK